MKFSHDWMADTHPDALRAYLDIQRQIPAEQKLLQVSAMYEAITALQTSEERRLHPDACDREIFLRVTARRLGPDLMRKVYGWEPDR